MSTTSNRVQIDRIRTAGRRGPKSNRTALRRRPRVEILDGRVLLSVGFDPASETFTGDGTAHTLLLSENAGYLAYTVNPDGSDATTVTTSDPISASTPITVDLGNAGNTLRLDSSWTFTNPVTFVGGSGGDTLDDETGDADTWTLTDSNDGNIDGSVAFTSVSTAIDSGGGTLIGANADSTWDFAGTQTYSLNASPSHVLTFSGYGTIQGGSGNDTFNLMGDGITNQVFANLYGGSGDDTFAFINGTQINGNIDGQGGDNTLDYSGYGLGTAVSLIGADANGYTGTEATSITGTFQRISNLVGANSGGDHLMGLDADSTWSLGSTSTYQASGDSALTFSDYNVLEGGTAADDFVVTAAQPDLVFIDGGGGGDTLDLSGYASGETVTLTGSDGTGFSGGTSSALGTVNSPGTFAGMSTIVGVAGDTLAGEDVASTWSLGTSQTYSDGSNTLGFSDFSTLQGGSAADDFVVTAAQPDLMMVNGGGGGDTLDLSGYASGETVTLTGSDGTGFSGGTSSALGTVNSPGTFAGMSTIVGVAGDTLAGEDVASTWSLGTSQTYSDGSNTLGFSDFSTLQGSSAADDFVVTVATTDALQGGGGTDTLDLSGYATGQSVTLTGYDTSVLSAGFSGTTGGVTGAFTGIDVLDGLAGDTLVGDANNSTWDISSTPTYQETGSSVSVAFSGFNTLQAGTGANVFNIINTTSDTLLGGAGNDSFVFSAGMLSTGTINGGGGTNTFDYSAYTTPVTVNLASHTATGASSWSNIQSLIGSNTASSTLIAANATNNWSIAGTNSGSISGPSPFSFTNVGNLTGGILNDNFTFAAGAVETGTLSGGSGTNTLNMAANTSGVTVNISTNNGGSATADGASFNFSGIANLVGGSGNNTFFLGNGKTISGTINGGVGGTNTLNYSAFTTGIRVNLTQMAATGIDSGAANGISNFQNVTGGSGNDILIGDSANNVLIDGNGNDVVVGVSGNDTLTVGSGQDILIGGTGASTLNAGSGQDILIADGTTYDTNVTALTALMAEWGRTNETYTTRVAHLNGTLAGGLNGTYKLTSATIITNTNVDTVSSGAGLDWYIAPAIDNATLPPLKTIGGVKEQRTTL